MLGSFFKRRIPRIMAAKGENINLNKIDGSSHPRLGSLLFKFNSKSIFLLLRKNLLFAECSGFFRHEASLSLAIVRHALLFSTSAALNLMLIRREMSARYRTSELKRYFMDHKLINREFQTPDGAFASLIA